MITNRRTVAGLVAAVLITAGCLGVGGSQSDLRATEINADWTESGGLEVQVTVSNFGDAAGTGTVFVEADVRGGDSYSDRRDVTVSANGSETVVVVFEPPADAVGSGFNVNARME